MRVAFKEWAVVVDALGRGAQILILRKGGISEGPGGFKIDHPEFLLFPTRFHQQIESVVPSARPRCEEALALLPEPSVLRIEYCASVEAQEQLDSPAAVQRLRGQHIWRDEVIEQRYDWGREKAIFAMALRVARLPAPIELPMLPAYGGCKSWVELDREIDTIGAKPVLNQAEFQERLGTFRAALTTPCDSHR